MKNFWLIGGLLSIVACNSTDNHQANTTDSTINSTTDVHKKEVTEDASVLDTSAILIEVNKILEKINKDNTCNFEYGDNNTPNIETVGETNIMKAEINEIEVSGLVDMFHKKCHNNNLEKISNDRLFWPKGKYALEAYFNTPGTERSYFNCLIKGQNRHAFYSIKNN